MRAPTLTAEDRAIWAQLSPAQQRSYAKGHKADVAAADLWARRRGYLDIPRRVSCLGESLRSYWEIASKHPRRR